MSPAIDYPVVQSPVCIVGRPARWQRSLTMMPVVAGQYSLVLWPSDLLSLDLVRRYDFPFAGGDVAPVRLVVSFDDASRNLRDWRWKLVRHRRQLDLPSATEFQPQGFSVDNSDLIFNEPAIADGAFSLADPIPLSSERTLVWSCHQPFDTADDGALRIQEGTDSVLEWFQRQVELFKPDVIWGLGDTAYADGTEADDFIGEFYSHPARLAETDGQADLRRRYREMYLNHWRFDPLQKAMRNVAHICIWDDHEIRDGWGSESSDLESGADRIYPVARGVAEEFILNLGPRVRPTDQFPDADAHQAYIDATTAVFIFDGRSSRKYRDQQGHVISEHQFRDFESFCSQLATDHHQVTHLLMGCAVPFLNLQDYVSNLGSKVPKAVTDLLAGIRDDVRDSWNSPGNREQFRQLISVLRRLHARRPEVSIVNVSGDIHVASAFTFQPPGFISPLYQITTSALTQRSHPPEILAPLLYLDDRVYSETMGLVQRLWSEVSNPNLLLVEPHSGKLRFKLRVFDESAESLDTLANAAADLIIDV